MCFTKSWISLYKIIWSILKQFSVKTPSLKKLIPDMIKSTYSVSQLISRNLFRWELIFPFHTVEKREILPHSKLFSSNQLFSNFFSKTITFTKFLRKNVWEKISAISTLHTVLATKQKSPENKDLQNAKFTLIFNFHLSNTL